MCTLSLGAWAKGCMTIGGIEKAYVIDKSSKPADLTYAVSGNTITITAGASTATAYEIDPVQNSLALTNPVTADPNANSVFYTQTLTGILNDNAAGIVNTIQEVNKGRTEWLLKFRDGTYRMIGTDVNGMQANGGDGFASGQAAGDAQGTTISLVSESSYVAPVLEDFATFEAAFDITVPVA